MDGISVRAYRNTLVVAVDSGAVLGRVHAMVLDFETRSVAGFVLRSGEDGTGPKRWGSVELIRSYGTDAMTLDSSRGLFDRHGAPELLRLREAERAAYRKPVFTVTGEKVGRILDTYVDGAGRITAFELFSESHFDGVFRGVLLLSDDVIFGQDVILVPPNFAPLLKAYVEDDDEDGASRAQPLTALGPSADEEGQAQVLSALEPARRAVGAKLRPLPAAAAPLPSPVHPLPSPVHPISDLPLSRPSDPARPQIFPELDGAPAASGPGAPAPSEGEGRSSVLPEGLPPGIDEKLVGFVLGRTASRDLLDAQGNVLVARGTCIDLKAVLLAHELDLMPKLFLAASTTLKADAP